jgi:type II secretory pathway component GspD/PulD (secretin)
MRSFVLRDLTGPEAADVVARIMPDVRVEGWNEKTLFVRGRGKKLQQVQELLLVEDKPAPQVALRFQLIEANGFANSDTSIARVESVLRNVFRFQGYRLAAETFMTVKRESNARQVIVGNDGVSYALDIEVNNVIRREGKASAEMTVNLSLPAIGLHALSTSVNVPDGQTIVLGTARPDAKRGALILVVTPEIR